MAGRSINKQVSPVILESYLTALGKYNVPIQAGKGANAQIMTFGLDSNEDTTSSPWLCQAKRPRIMT